MSKFQKISSYIKDRMEEFRDLASASIVETKPSDQGDYMVNGVA